MATPPDPPGYDTHGWPRDVLAAWIEADEEARQAVRDAAPEVARALDREAAEVMQPGPRRPRWLRDPDRPPRPVPWQDEEGGS